MNTKINEFDLKAAEWDKNPMHWDRSKTIANEITKLVPLKKEMTAIEYGAGTGIASFLLKDYLKEITLMDNSYEMINIMNEKIRATKADNMKALNFDLEHNDYNGEKVDLIFTQMVLHHVINIKNIFKRFQNLLKPGGYLAIADLYPEDGSFHGVGFEGHPGFDPAELAGILESNRFGNISHRTCYTIDRKLPDTEVKQFEVFLLIANRL